MRLLLSLTLAVLSCFGTGAQAGQGFYVTIKNAIGQSDIDLVVRNIIYTDWYLKGLQNGVVAPYNQSKTVYTERCSAVFGCWGESSGTSSTDIPHVIFDIQSTGITWSSIAELCIGTSPADPCTGVHWDKTVYAGRYSMACKSDWPDKFSCNVEAQEAGDQIKIVFTMFPRKQD